MPEENPVKRILYDYLQKLGDREIENYLSQEKSSEIINKIITECYPKVIELEYNLDENISDLTTALMHYLLTNSLIPSQRKIVHKGIELDIIIPDLRTLMSKPENSLVICIPKKLDCVLLKKRIKEIQKVQPVKQNLWFILKEKFNLDQKTFVVNDETLTSILDEIKQFLSEKKQTQFKIFKSNVV